MVTWLRGRRGDVMVVEVGGEKGLTAAEKREPVVWGLVVGASGVVQY